VVDHGPALGNSDTVAAAREPELPEPVVVAVGQDLALTEAGVAMVLTVHLGRRR
jgi:hypothetical protein